jgi:hypothetical protein
VAYSVTTKKTWAAILDDIEDSLARWRGVTLWRVDTVLAPRSSTKQNQTEQERTVTLHYTRKGKPYQIKMDRQRRAVDNLLVIWLILETLRLNEARGFAAEIAAVYRQEFPALPAPGQSGQAAAQPTRSDGAYALLHLRSNAPIEVCEAAYRALSKLFHPDVTGSSATQQSLNAAIEIIRKEKTK